MIILGLQDEIRRNDEARYDHRLHAILLIAQGMSCPEVAFLLGDSTRTIEYWVNKFEKHGLAGLVDVHRPGRKPRLNSDQLEEIESALRKPPSDFNLNSNLWDGKTLSEFISQNYNVTLGVRQCQRMFRQFGFRYRKPRSLIGKGDPELKSTFKKTSVDE
jgi:transposase